MGTVQRFSVWLKPAARVLGLAMATVAPLLVAHWPDAEKDRLVWLQRSGLGLQLLGFYSVWSQIRDALKHHGRPGGLERLKAWWEARPKNRDVTVGTSGVAAMGFAGSATGRVTRGTGDGSSEARIGALEHNLVQLQGEFDRSRRDSQREVEALKTQLEAEEHARTTTTGDLAKRIENQAVGSADVQLVGLAWFAAGSIYSTVPDLLLHLGFL